MEGIVKLKLFGLEIELRRETDDERRERKLKEWIDSVARVNTETVRRAP